MRRQNLLCAAVFALAFLGVLPALYFEARSLIRRGPGRPIDDRYAELRTALPAEPALGYLSDVAGPDAAEMRTQAQYALAPHLLVQPGPSTRYIVANLRDPLHLKDICNKRRMRAVVVLDNGVALLETRVQP